MKDSPELFSDPRVSVRKLNFDVEKGKGKGPLVGSGIDDRMTRAATRRSPAGKVLRCDAKDIRMSSEEVVHFDRCYSDLSLDEMLKALPDGEERRLRRLGLGDLIHEGMANIFMGVYSFMIASEQLRHIIIDWKRARKELDEVQRKLEETEMHFKAVTKVNDDLEELVSRESNEYYGMVEVIERLIDQVGNAYAHYRRSNEYRNALANEFLKGVQSYKSKIEERFPDFDLSWIDIDELKKNAKTEMVEDFEEAGKE